MKIQLYSIAAAVSCVLMYASPTWAAEQTVRLSIPTMDCPVCPITVKKALTKVEGVMRIAVSFEKREALVTFDDSKTRVQALTEATANAGYPSKPVKSTSR